MMSDEQQPRESAPSESNLPAGAPEDGFYGGQAVLEGVMMRNRQEYAVAVRREDGRIVVAQRPVATFFAQHTWTRWPLLRGFFGFIDAFVLGYQSLEFSAQVLAKEDDEKAGGAPGGGAAGGEGEQAPVGIPAFTMGVTTALALLLGLALFAVLPTLGMRLAGELRHRTASAKSICLFQCDLFDNPSPFDIMLKRAGKIRIEVRLSPYVSELRGRNMALYERYSPKMLGELERLSALILKRFDIDAAPAPPKPGRRAGRDNMPRLEGL